MNLLGLINLWPPFDTTAAHRDLLAALVQYLLRTPSVTSLLGAPTSVFHELAGATDSVPFVLVENYIEVLPGETADDQMANVRLCCYAADETSARRLGTAVKNAVDSQNENPNSIRTRPLLFHGGRSTGTMRNPSRPRKVRGISKGSVYSWVEEIDYEIWITPDQ